MKQHAVAGWAAILALVGLYDLTALRKNFDTLSAGFYKASRTRGAPVVVLLWLYLTLHLFRLIPLKWDPLRRMCL